MDWMTIFTGIIAIVTSLGILGGFIWFIIRLSFKAIETDIGHIKKDLSNHITDTNKKIDELKTELKEDIKELKTELKEDMKELKDLILKKL